MKKQGLMALVLSGWSLLAQADVVATDAWVREVPPVSPSAAVFVSLENRGDQAVTIMRLSSPLAAAVEWHDMHHHDGMMHMQARQDIVLPAGSRHQLAPGGSHLMLVDLQRPLRVGDVVPLSLELSTRQVVTINAVVRRSEPATPARSKHHHH